MLAAIRWEAAKRQRQINAVLGASPGGAELLLLLEVMLVLHGISAAPGVAVTMQSLATATDPAP